jgi:hypothetical protein
MGFGLDAHAGCTQVVVKTQIEQPDAVPQLLFGMTFQWYVVPEAKVPGENECEE